MGGGGGGETLQMFLDCCSVKLTTDFKYCKIRQLLCMTRIGKCMVNSISEMEHFCFVLDTGSF
jgi:hypothetical protein